MVGRRRNSSYRPDRHSLLFRYGTFGTNSPSNLFDTPFYLQHSFLRIFVVWKARNFCSTNNYKHPSQQHERQLSPCQVIILPHVTRKNFADTVWTDWWGCQHHQCFGREMMQGEQTIIIRLISAIETSPWSIRQSKFFVKTGTEIPQGNREFLAGKWSDGNFKITIEVLRGYS